MKKEINFASGKKLFCILMVGLLLLSACGESRQEKEVKPAEDAVADTDLGTDTGTNPNTDHESDTDSNINMNTDIESDADSNINTNTDIESNSDSNTYINANFERAIVVNTDTVETDFGFPYVTESENGYYFWEEMLSPDLNIYAMEPRMLFMDKATGWMVPLCNKPNCSHQDRECNACFPEEWAGKDGMSRFYIQYYEGSLYVFGTSADGYLSLYRMKADGSGDWEISTKLYRVAAGNYETPNMLIVDDYIYYVDWNQKHQTLERVKLGGGTPEVVYAGPEGLADEIIATYILEPKYIEGFLYFLTISYLDDNYDVGNSVGGLFQCDTQTGQCRIAKDCSDEYIGPWSVHDGYVYYGGMNYEGLCRYSIRDGVEEILSDDPIRCPNITLTQDYIIVCDQEAGVGYGPGSHPLVIYDYEGNQLRKIRNTISSIACMESLYGGNSEILFGCWDDAKNSGMCFLDMTLPIEEWHWEKMVMY